MSLYGTIRALGQTRAFMAMIMGAFGNNDSLHGTNEILHVNHYWCLWQQCEPLVAQIRAFSVRKNEQPSVA